MFYFGIDYARMIAGRAMNLAGMVAVTFSALAVMAAIMAL